MFESCAPKIHWEKAETWENTALKLQNFKIWQLYSQYLYCHAEHLEMTTYSIHRAQKGNFVDNPIQFSWHSCH